MKKSDIWVTVGLIVAYSAIFGSLRSNYGDAHLFTAAGMAVFSLILTVYAAVRRLWDRMGLSRLTQDRKRLLYLLPMWILATGNLWSGIGKGPYGSAELYAMCTMLLAGYVEEFLFRGLLFTGMLKDGSAKTAIAVSALTFGMGHIINLFTGQSGPETLVQIVFAVAWGLIFTMVFYKGGSLIPCIIAHSMIDVFSVINVDDNMTASMLFIGATIVLGCAYCAYLARIPGNKLT